MRLERSQEVDDILLLLGGQPIKALNDSIGLATGTQVLFDGLHQAACPSVMKEKDALPNAPERGSSELVGAGATLRDAVRKTSTHVVDEEIGE